MENNKNIGLYNETLSNVNINNLTSIRQSGIYNVDINTVTYNQLTKNINNSTIKTLIDSMVNIKNLPDGVPSPDLSTYLECICGKNTCVQKIITSKIILSRTGIKKNNEFSWSDWGVILKETPRDEDITTLGDSLTYDFGNIQEAFIKYLKSIKGESYRDINYGRQSAYDDSKLKTDIRGLLDYNQKVNMVPTTYDLEGDPRQSETLTPTNRDWLSIGRVDTGQARGIFSKSHIAYTFNGNPDDQWYIMRNSDRDLIIGHDRFDRIFIEGHWRPVFSLSWHENGNVWNGRRDQMMVISDLDWKWFYNGGGIQTASTRGLPVSEGWIRCNPGFPMNNTTAPYWAMGVASVGYGRDEVSVAATGTRDAAYAGIDPEVLTFYASTPMIIHALWR